MAHTGALSPAVASGYGHGVPRAECSRTQQPLLGGTQLMSSDAEQVPCDVVDGQKALGLRGRLTWRM
jgi:hypothetical protein